MWHHNTDLAKLKRILIHVASQYRPGRAKENIDSCGPTDLSKLKRILIHVASQYRPGKAKENIDSCGITIQTWQS